MKRRESIDEIETDFGTVRIVSSGETQEALISAAARHAPDFHPPPEARTPMQKTRDEIFDNADKDAITARETATSSLAWLELIVDLPRDLRHNLPKLLADLQVLIHDERRLRQ